jgi:hypothetical protein
MEFALKVTGNVIIPNCKGRYRENGYYGTQLLYQKGMTSWWIWWDVTALLWRISKAAGDMTNMWKQTTPTPQPTGNYEPDSPEVEGKPVVSVYP